MFTGILFVALGSAYYHFSPNNNSLVYDRIPMTIVFMSLLSATVAEFIDLKWGVRLLLPLLFIGVISVLWWHFTEERQDGDLRLYFLVQFFPMIMIPLIMLLFRSPAHDRASRLLIWVVVWYIIAKVFERYDEATYTATGFISGHSIKHLAAAVSTWYLVRMFKRKYIGKKSIK